MKISFMVILKQSNKCGNKKKKTIFMREMSHAINLNLMDACFYACLTTNAFFF